MAEYNRKAIALAGLLKGLNAGLNARKDRQVQERELAQRDQELAQKAKYYDAYAQKAQPRDVLTSLSQLQGLVGPGSGMRMKSIGPNGPTFEPDTPPELTAGQKLATDKATQSIFDTVEQSKVKQEMIDDAESVLPNAPVGLVGKLRVEWMKRFDPNNPVLSDWQKIKTVATDAQLMNTAKTKGAISDREMDLFAQAAANDDLLSAPRLKPILIKIEKALEADKESKFNAYQKMYGEDPRTWFNELSSGESNDLTGMSDDELKRIAGV